MPPTRRGRSRPFATPELRGTLGTLLRTTLAQAGAVREALERGAREGRARLDDVRLDRKRADAMAELGAVVHELIRRGELAELEDVPAIADALAAIDELEARGQGRRDRRDDEHGRDWITPESRSRFDRAAPRGDDEGTVSSSGWRPPAPAKPARVWRPTGEPAAPPDAADHDPPRREPAKEPGARSISEFGSVRGGAKRPRGGIDFGGGDDADADLEEYMHPDDVPPGKK